MKTFKSFADFANAQNPAPTRAEIADKLKTARQQRFDEIMKFTLAEMDAMDFSVETGRMSESQKDAILNRWTSLRQAEKEQRRAARIPSTMSKLLQVGDKVVMQMDEEARYWGRKGPADGTIGVVTGHYVYTQHRHRYGNDLHFYTPGIYQGNGAPLVQWEGANVAETVSDYDIYMMDRVEAERRYHELWVKPVHQDKIRTITEQENLLSNIVRIGDLPESEFYELDVVEFTTHTDFNDRYDNAGNPVELRVTGIKYDFAYGDGTKGHHYDVAWFDKATGEHARMGSTSGQEKELRLVARGNVWNHYKSVSDNILPLTFKSILEEASFHSGMAWVDEVRNPRTGLYSWTLDETLDAIQKGEADGFTQSNAFGLSDKLHISVRRFKDRDLGERVRKTTLEGFGK